MGTALHKWSSGPLPSPGLGFPGGKMRSSVVLGGSSCRCALHLFAWPLLLQEDHIRPQRDQCPGQVLSPAAGGRGRAGPGPRPSSGLAWLCDLGRGLAVLGSLDRDSPLLHKGESPQTQAHPLSPRNWRLGSRLVLGMEAGRSGHRAWALLPLSHLDPLAATQVEALRSHAKIPSFRGAM